MRPDETSDIRLLSRTASTGDDARELSSEVDEFGLEVVEAELKGFSVDDETAVEFGADEIELITNVFGGPD